MKEDATLLQILEKSHRPMTAVELIELMGFHKTTVYRQLSKLVHDREIREVVLSDGIIRYEIDDGSHHHHLLCQKCGSVDNVRLNSEAAVLTEIMERSNYKIKNHLIEFSGICPNCQ